MVGVPNTYRAFDQKFLGENHEDNLCSHIHFVVQFVCCCNSDLDSYSPWPGKKREARLRA
jgi:hypothetical protein